ncbi:MAG: hypothetical protein KF784_06945 [Fimbriimonadaceae bacterium]|nr:hypothetical protein [Fimbriimonadaceae bacterium]
MIPIFALGLGLLFGLGNAEVKSFERTAAQDILSRLGGPDKKVSVHTELNGIIGGPMGDIKRATITASDFTLDSLPLFTEPERSQKGVLRELNLKLNNFSLGGLRIEELEAKIPDCRYDYALAISKRQIRLSKSGEGVGVVRILEEDLEAFILHKFREIKQVSVRIRDDYAFVEGFGEFIFIKTGFFVLAKITSPDGNRLMLTNARIVFDDGPASEAAKQALLHSLNPVVDLNKDLNLFGAITVEKISLERGVLEASGRTRIPARPEDSLLNRSDKTNMSYKTHPKGIGPSPVMPSILVTS